MTVSPHPAHRASDQPPVSHSMRAAPAPSRTALSRSIHTGTRIIETAALLRDGSRHIGHLKVPALNLFESAFSAFARGTLLQGTDRDIAVEDLQPGDDLWTTSGNPAQVLWIGSANFAPSDANGRRMSLVRIMADSFGEGRPETFLTLGPSARILQTPPHLRAGGAPGALLTPVTEFIDGVNVIEVSPPTPVTLFHIVLDRHAAIRAGGLECETFHPGSQAVRSVSHSVRDLFLSMFPHIAHVTDFGPLAHARAPESSPMLEAAGY